MTRKHSLHKNLKAIAIALFLLLIPTAFLIYRLSSTNLRQASAREPSRVASATSKLLALLPGESGRITCDSRLRLTWVDGSRKQLDVLCVSPSPSPTRAVATIAPTSTVAPTIRPTITATPPPHSDHGGAMDDMRWHPPGSHGDRPRHEHGDAPPQWVIAAGYDPMFNHHANTPNENVAYWKHTGFKGWAGRFHGVDWYGIFHLDFNPAGHVSRFHSYQMWLRDRTGAVSHMHGWLDFGQGNNTGPNLVVGCSADTSIRPIINPPSQGCDITFESWYARAGQADWMIDFGFNINPNYYAGGDINNPQTWNPTGGVRNVDRRIEFAWYPFRSSVRGEFYATQFGDIVSGPNDRICGTQRTYGVRNYTVLCLRQYIAPTLTEISFPGNSVGRVFPGTNLQLPN